MDFIDQAIQFSAKAHHNQFRKGTDLPYISHPYAVGMILMKHGCTEKEITAGILHDTVEDTSVTLKEIQEKFGKEVADIVEGCSEPNKDLSWEERKQHTIDYLQTAPIEVRLVACADKLHNIRSISHNEKTEGPTIWNRFKRGKDDQAWYYQNVMKSLEFQGGFPLLEELKTEVKELFS
ncbi:HD domain-containing protein [Salinibacillus xinjiangensis]|uniref:HD domain-containing protein n=1 Tax=Salinibacillus xinjiangensis TaxID=1229268 RepID=A0A6G1X5P9_9BACI|nr:HD domain-containing protein [Salinibacillus xinjiangensis]MRG86294.1 HD domain-containing protein [Salinibacillus xinjiangensis]